MGAVGHSEVGEAGETWRGLAGILDRRRGTHIRGKLGCHPFAGQCAAVQV